MGCRLYNTWILAVRWIQDLQRATSRGEEAGERDQAEERGGHFSLEEEEWARRSPLLRLYLVSIAWLSASVDSSR